MAENEVLYACGLCGATELPHSLWKLQEGGKLSGLCTLCAASLVRHYDYVPHLGTLTISRRKEPFPTEEVGGLTAACSACTEAVHRWAEFAASLARTIELVIVSFWRLELYEYLVAHRAPAWLAPVVSSRLPEWFLRRLVGQVIAVDEEPAQETLCQPEFCEDPQFYEGDEYALFLDGPFEKSPPWHAPVLFPLAGDVPFEKWSPRHALDRFPLLDAEDLESEVVK